ncbi:transcription antitermination factor NusB [Rubrolithibacter danxiaensis]|uniref:transcription antitermination factor NusB n=1 Tax=Rubrolithibacter danxiaensis TaxID=3390805 RepID=UPI003BF91410
MLNRRHLRVKVLQVLYAYHLSENKAIKSFEKSLLESIDQVNEMYIWLLSSLIEVADYTLIDAEERANKYLPTESDLNASTKLYHNKFIASLRENTEYLDAVKKYKISWSFDPEIIRTIFNALKGSAEYESYLVLEDHSIRAEKDIIKHIFKKIILKSPGIEQVFEEKFINWQVDKEVLQALVSKTFKNFQSEIPAENKLAQISPNWIEDRQFVIELLTKTVAFDSEWQEMIAEKTRNWEAERIALMDTLLMKMAITELTQFPSIPVKVTINEYIDISKDFSTPKSNSFINGILDKISYDLKSTGRIRKIGRGLVE